MSEQKKHMRFYIDSKEYLLDPDMFNLIVDRSGTDHMIVIEAYLTNEMPSINKKLDNLLNKKKKPKKETKMVFITIQDFQRRYNDIEELKTFIRRTKYLYSERYWYIESGSKKDINECNFHIHMVARIKNSSKHKKKLNMEWNKFFNTDLQGDNDFYQLKNHYECDEMPPYEQWLEEKIEYGINECKQSHENSFTDPSWLGQEIPATINPSPLEGLFGGP